MTEIQKKTKIDSEQTRLPGTGKQSNEFLEVQWLGTKYDDNKSKTNMINFHASQFQIAFSF